jgi:two-component system, OmpR family, response regulator CpxR
VSIELPSGTVSLERRDPVPPVRVLIIDDDRELTGLLSELLAQEGFALEAHHTGKDAAATAVAGGYALVVLDVMLPHMNGFEILKEIRRQSNIPVILLTARGDDVDRVVGLEIGADDYVPKPFNARELTARIRAVLRRADARATGRPDRQVLRVDDVTLDPSSRRVTCAGTPLELTTVEFDLLRVLLEAAGETVHREAMAERVLGRRFDPFDRSVDMHISKLRRKLGPRVAGDDRIKSIRSIGYIYTLPATGQ